MWYSFFTADVCELFDSDQSARPHLYVHYTASLEPESVATICSSLALAGSGSTPVWPRWLKTLAFHMQIASTPRAPAWARQPSAAAGVGGHAELINPVNLSGHWVGLCACVSVCVCGYSWLTPADESLPQSQPPFLLAVCRPTWQAHTRKGSGVHVCVSCCVCVHACMRVRLHKGWRIIDVEHTHANEHRARLVCMVCVCLCVVIKPAMFYWPADTVHKKISGPNPLVV